MEGFKQSDNDCPNMCLFQVRNEQELIEVSFYLETCGVEYSMFCEPDFGNENTAICTEIIYSDEDRQLFADFKLY